MLCLKKVYNDELLQLALILSLLRVNFDSYSEPNLLENIGNLDLDNGTSWRAFTPALLRSHYVHPKSLDSILLNYERDLFADLNSLGRYNREYIRHSNVTTYLLNIDRASNLASASQEPIPEGNGNSEQDPSNPQHVLLADNTENISNSTAASDFVLDLSPEDMNLIEILWKQDVDLGFSIDVNTNEEDPKLSTSATTSLQNEDVEIIKTDEKIDEKIEIKEEEEKSEEDPWKGLNCTIDAETGEYVIKDEQIDDILGAECGSPLGPLPLEDLPLPLEEFLLDEALGLVDLDEESLKGESDVNSIPEEKAKSTSEGEFAIADPADGLSQESEDSLDALRDMIQTPQFHHPHHRAFQSRMPFVRTMSMEQRWQDLANLLSFPGPTDGSAMHHAFSHHHPLHNYNHSHPHSMGYGAEATRGVLLHNATLAPPMGDVNGTLPFGNLGGTNLGNAVATSMNLTNSSEPMGESNSAPHYKLEPSHDVMYYQNGTNEFNQTDGFLSSILNDEDLQLMDMAVNEGMYTMRMLDTNNSISGNVNICSGISGGTNMSRTEMERVDTSSDSAVSSMGSERVPSLSDGEWCDAGSDSGHTVGDHYVTDYQTKYRPYDYSYSSRQHSLSASDPTRLPVAQKKHQMFGKRYFQEQGSATAMGHPPPTPIKYEYRDPTAPTASFTNISHVEEEVGPKNSELKYSCSIEFSRHHPSIVRTPISHIQHNHTYSLPPENSGVMPRPMSRDKVKSKKSDEEHLTRDEKRARALNIPISVDDIINLPMDEFNERLSKYDLSEAQLSLIRDIRRRGKNKVAAQNCRKRKLDQINTLADEVKEMRDRKLRLKNEYDYHTNELKRMKDKYQQLYRHVFQNLRDPEGNQYSPYHYSLQTSADGSIIVVPRSNSTLNPIEKKEHMQDHKNG